MNDIELIFHILIFSNQELNRSISKGNKIYI
jgi:hypothetical protein